jgi:hypothetical protein
MAAGGWRLAAGGWRLAAGGWRLAAGGWRLAAGGWRLAAGGWRLAAGGWWLVAGFAGFAVLLVCWFAGLLVLLVAADFAVAGCWCVAGVWLMCGWCRCWCDWCDWCDWWLVKEPTGGWWLLMTNTVLCSYRLAVEEVLLVLPPSVSHISCADHMSPIMIWSLSMSSFFLLGGDTTPTHNQQEL